MQFTTPSGATQPNYLGVQVQTSVSTLPIPVGWGTYKCAPNLVEYTDFKNRNTNNRKDRKNYGKDYSATVQLAICQGPINDVPLILIDSNTQSTVQALHGTLGYGTFPEQAPWTYMVNNHPDEAWPYAGTAWLGVENMDLGSSATVPNHEMLV